MPAESKIVGGKNQRKNKHFPRIFFPGGSFDFYSSINKLKIDLLVVAVSGNKSFSFQSSYLCILCLFW